MFPRGFGPRSSHRCPRVRGRGGGVPALRLGTRRQGPDRHRAPRRVGVPAGAHARVLRARRPHGRRLHRAGPGAPRRTASWSPGTRTRSAARPTSTTKPQFADRKKTKTIDGVAGHRLVHRGLHARRAEDVARQGTHPGDPPAQHALRRPVRGADAAGGHRPLASACPASCDREIGIYPETKHPTYFKSIGLALEPKLVDTLNRNGLNRRSAKVYVQSFEVGEPQGAQQVACACRWCSWSTAPARRTTSSRPVTSAPTPTWSPRPVCARCATYADGIGPTKDLIIPRDANGFLQAPTTLVQDAHKAGLIVHSWTFRNENSFLPADFRSSTDPAAYGRAFEEYDLFFKQGIDGVFADNPDTAVKPRSSASQCERAVPVEQPALLEQGPHALTEPVGLFQVRVAGQDELAIPMEWYSSTRSATSDATSPAPFPLHHARVRHRPTGSGRSPARERHGSIRRAAPTSVAGQRTDAPCPAPSRPRPGPARRAASRRTPSFRRGVAADRVQPDAEPDRAIGQRPHPRDLLRHVGRRFAPGQELATCGRDRQRGIGRAAEVDRRNGSGAASASRPHLVAPWTCTASRSRSRARPGGSSVRS